MKNIKSRVAILIILALISLYTVACKSETASSNLVVVNGHTISEDEFMEWLSKQLGTVKK